MIMKNMLLSLPLLMAMAKEPLLVVATPKELLLVTITLATFNKLLLITTFVTTTLKELNTICCNNTKGVTCYRTTTTTALSEMHFHSCLNFQRIDGRSFLFIDFIVVGKMPLKLDPL
jgi:hypothetical protein